MTCADCGRVSEGRLCRECERDRRWEDRFDEALGADDDDDDAGAAPVATDGGQVTLDERLLAIDDSEAVEIAYDTPQATTTQTVRGIVQKSGRDGGVKLIPPGTAYLLADEVGGDRSYRVWATGEVESITDPRQLHDDDHRNPSRIGEFVDIREVFGDGGVRPPKIYQVVELPESEKGMPCPRWMGDPPKPCDNRAEYVFVFEATLDEDSDDRKNCLCCGECRPQPGVWTDGGEAIDYEGAGFVVSSVYRLDSMRELADDPATPSGIAEATGNDIPQISRALGNLREKGLVELLVAEETHKGRIYGLTERGESVLSAANQVVRHDAGGDGP